MKFQHQETLAEFSGPMEIDEYSIGDPITLIEHTTKTLYSNKIRCCIQEYISNSRDAHIEMNKDEVPVTVILPNRFDSTIKFCDNGPGISPTRMKKFFIQYGKSTKRHSNREMGGFGLGCKVAWCYTDTFIVRTIANEDGQLVLRTYANIKEQGKAPKLLTLGKPIIIDVDDQSIPDADKKTGTIVSFDVKPEDFEACKAELVNVTRFWKVRPIIEGCVPLPEYPEFKWAYENENWKIGYGVDEYGYGTNGFLCVDGIPYPINRNAFADMARAVNVYDICKTNYVLFFNVGELSISLSRESLQYDDITKKAIVQRLVEMKSWLNANLQKQIEEAPTLWDATILYKKLNSVFEVNQVVGDVFWHGIKVDNNASIYCQYGNCRRYFNEIKTPGLDPKIKSKKDYSVKIETDTLFAINDEEKTYMGKIATLLDQHPDKMIYVYTPENSESLDKLRAKVPGFDEYKPIMMSTVIKKKLPKVVKSGMTRAKWYLMKETEIVTADDSDDSNEISYKEGGGYYVFASRYNRTDGIMRSVSEIQKFLADYAPDETVYVVKEKYYGKLNDKFVHLDVLVKEIMNVEIEKIDCDKYFAKNVAHDYKFKAAYDNSLKDFILNNIGKLDGTYFKDWIDISDNYEKETTDDVTEYIVNICKRFGHAKVSNTPAADQIIDPKLCKYSKLFEMQRNIFNRIVNGPSYWRDMTKDQEVFAYDVYVSAIKKIFIDT